MLYARRPSVWSSRTDLTADGKLITSWKWQAFSRTLDLDLDGRRYRVVSSGVVRARFELVDDRVLAVAGAERVGSGRWTLDADGRSHEFRRRSIWSPEQQMMSGDTVIGHVRVTGGWRGAVEADLPWLSRPAQVFVVVAVTAVWAAAQHGSS